MKITLEIPDIKTAAIALNNACIAYGDLIYSVLLGASIPEKFRCLEKVDEEVLKERFECVKSIYQQIEAIEKEMT